MILWHDPDQFDNPPSWVRALNDAVDRVPWPVAIGLWIGLGWMAARL